MTYEILVFAPLLGMLAGFLSGLLGIGGGIIIVPSLLYLLPKLEQVNEANVAIIAIATSLATIVVTTFSSAKSHYKKGNVDFAMAAPVALSVAVSSLLTTFVASDLGSFYLTLFFAVILLILATQMLVTRKAQCIENHMPEKPKLYLGGALTGVIASLAGLGGGAVLVPYFSYIKVGIHKAIGVAAACGMVVASFGSIGYLINGWNWTNSNQFVGFVHWPTALAIMIFSYICAPLGAKLSHKLNQKQLKKVFAVFMILVSIELIINLFY